MRTALACLAVALCVVPLIAQAAARDAKTVSPSGDAQTALSQTNYALTPGTMPEEIVVTGERQRQFAAEARRNRQAAGVRFGDGAVQYIEGPSFDYRTSRRGPMFEIAALGGGLENAPYLAHVAVDWKF